MTREDRYEEITGVTMPRRDTSGSWCRMPTFSAAVRAAPCSWRATKTSTSGCIRQSAASRLTRNADGASGT